MKAFPPLAIRVLTLGCAFVSCTGNVPATPHNVLFITVDDFRPELPAYGATHILAPNMTRLSEGGLTFNRAYVQQAVCQPARANVLTGARPDTTRIYNVFENGTPTFRTTMGAVTTLPSVFKDNGYWTAGYGKIFHHVDNTSWTESKTFYTTADLYQDPGNRAIAGDPNSRPPWENYTAGVEADYMDAKVAAAAAAAIRARAADGQKFFIAAGFWKPHLPFTAPKAYWDMYDRNTLPLATGADALPVQGSLPPEFSDPYSGELATYKGGRPPFVAQTAATQAALANGTFTTNRQTGADWGIITVNGNHIYPEDYARSLTHGYYACTSFIDAQVGKLLAALEDPNNDGDPSDSILDDTIVVLWGDHGFHLGRHGSWPKHTNLDVATRIPFLIHHPDMPPGTKGRMTDALMESVDIMPTLLEMANLPVPTTHTLEGKSLAPLLADPNQTWKTAAFSQYPKESPMNSGIWSMGYAMRTATHTYVQWRSMQATDTNPISLANRNFTITDTIAYEELYDMVNDPKQNVNIGNSPSVRPLLDAYKSMVSTALSSGYANTQQVGSASPAAPAAQAVAFTGGTAVGDTLTAHYLFADANGDADQSSRVEWVRANAFAGPYDTVVGSGSTYTLQAADTGKFVKLRVTPLADAAPTTGTAVLSQTAVIAGTGFDDGSTRPASKSAVAEGFKYVSGVGIPEPILHLSFDTADLTDSSGASLHVTGTAGFASDHGRNYATLNGIDQSITAPILRSFPDGITIAFWTLAQDGEEGMPKNTALGWARQQSTTWGDGLLLSFGWNNTSKALVRVGFQNGQSDNISIPELTDWLNNWVHWTVVKNPTAGTMEVYRDGQLYSSVANRHMVPAFESQPWATGSGYRIGRYNDDYYKGYLDEYRIYDVALDAAGVQTLYQLGASTTPTAFNVTVNGEAQVGQKLTGAYDFVNPKGTEGTSTFQWYRTATESGALTAIEGANTLTYTPVDDDDNGFLVLGVTPAGDNNTVGNEAFSAPLLIGTFIDRSLANTVRRLTHDKKLNVVFFGGSITDGAGQNNGLPWRTRTQNWFNNTFSDVTFNFTNASISGTSSEFGVFRTDRHVLSARPDLVFVEFAVNDLEQPSDTRTRQTMEGIVRKIRTAHPTCDIIFLFTTTRANAVNFYEQGQLPSRTVAHQQVATHYGITTIDVAEALVAHKQMTGYPYRIEIGQPGASDPAANQYLPDHVHPSNLGHQVYGDTVQDVLEGLLSSVPPSSLVAHPLPALLSGYDMTSARLIDHNHKDVSFGAGWAVQSLGIGAGGRTEEFLTTTSASSAAPITVSFNGPELGIYYRRSTSGGQIAWNADSGAASGTFPFWHETLASFTSFAMLNTSLGNGRHQVTITPQAYTGHETLNIAGWMVMDESPVRAPASTQTDPVNIDTGSPRRFLRLGVSTP